MTIFVKMVQNTYVCNIEWMNVTSIIICELFAIESFRTV